MSELRVRAEEYLAMRRALGFKLTSQGRHLMSFVAFCEERAAGDRVTADLAIDWAAGTARQSCKEVYLAHRLDTVRLFARHLHALDPTTEVPPADVFPHRQGRVQPYLYSEQDLAALLRAAERLAPAMRGKTWWTLLGLLAVTGMRPGEACRLRCEDVDLEAGTLVIVDSKFGKSRKVFLHSTATAALHAYAQARRQVAPNWAGTFLVNTRGTALKAHNLHYTFALLIASAGVQASLGRAPRLHDIRHSFTVATMLDWYREGADVQARLPLLSTWLGHVNPKCTYWYLQAVPELLALAAGRLEQGSGR